MVRKMFKCMYEILPYRPCDISHALLLILSVAHPSSTIRASVIDRTEVKRILLWLPGPIGPALGLPEKIPLLLKRKQVCGTKF